MLVVIWKRKKRKNGIAKVRFWATQAREPARHYEHKETGYNYRMSNILAGIGPRADEGAGAEGRAETEDIRVLSGTSGRSGRHLLYART